MFHVSRKVNPYLVYRPETPPPSCAASLLSLWAGFSSFALIGHSLIGGAGWGAAYLTGGGALLAMWAIRRYLPKQFGNVVLALLAVDALYFIWQGPTLRRQMLETGLALIGLGEPPAETDVLALTLGLSMALLLGVLELEGQQHGLASLLLLSFLCLLPLLGFQPEPLCVLTLGGYVLSSPATERIRRANSPIRRRTVNVCAGASAVLFLLAGIMGTAIAVGTSEPLFSASYALEGTVRRVFSRISDADRVLNATGQLNRGNIYPTGAEHLRLWSDEIPVEPIYLKGFTGGDYTGHSWAEADEARDMNQVTQRLGWERWEYMVENLYDSMYFVLPYLSQRENSNARILYLAGADGDSFVPYFSRWDGALPLHGMDWSLYLYYPSVEMQVDWGAIESVDEQAGEWYASIQQAYSQIADETYTNLPASGLIRLRALVAANPQPNLAAVTAFILDILHSQATYTTTPGYTPLSEDYAEYFLFTSHQGYCQQFATAATLLYRLYGIPARYVTGYVAQPADFVVDEAGGYTAILTDASAHAWVEIWLPDYGWIPVEATPAAPNSAAPTETLAGALQAVDRWQGAVDIQQSQSQNTNETASVDTLTPQSFDLATLSVWGEVMTTPLAAAILLTPLLPDGVRALRRRRLLQRGPSALLVHLLSILDRIMPDKAPVTEENLPEILTVALPALSKAEARRLVALARRAQYARPEQAPSLKDIGWALDFCRKVELQFSIRLSAGKRLWLAFLGIY